ncbi:hypothetical protein U1872_00690 [Sphingomonas sp. RB3P16]
MATTLKLALVATPPPSAPPHPFINRATAIIAVLFVAMVNKVFAMTR